MKNGVVIYKSKYGATKQYAQWLAHDLKVPCIDIEMVSDQLLNDCDYIVMGSSVYYGNLLLRSFFENNLKILRLKEVFIFIVCATPESDEREQRKILTENIPGALLREDNTFFLPGKLDLKSLNLFDRIMLWAAAIFEKNVERKKVMKNGIDAITKESLIDLDIAVRASSLKKH